MIRQSLKESCKKRVPNNFSVPQEVELIKENDKYYLSGVWDLNGNSIPENIRDLTFKFSCETNEKIRNSFEIELLRDYEDVKLKDKFVRIKFEEDIIYLVEMIEYSTSNIEDWSKIRGIAESNAPKNMCQEGVYYIEFRHDSSQESYNTSDSDIFYYTKSPHSLLEYDNLKEYLNAEGIEKKEIYSNHFHIFGNEKLDKAFRNYYDNNYSKFVKKKEKSSRNLRKTVIEQDKRESNEKYSCEVDITREI